MAQPVLHDITLAAEPILGKRSINSVQGFSLIELMVVVVIMALIAVIALPSYQKHLRHKWQTQAQQQGLLVASQLSRWRAKRLSYAGFVMMPTTDTASIGVEDRGEIFFPNGSNQDDYYYLLTLRDVTGQLALTQANTNGNGWRMLITPNPKQQTLQLTAVYYLDSLGQRCRFESMATTPDISEQPDCTLQPGW